MAGGGTNPLPASRFPFIQAVDSFSEINPQVLDFIANFAVDMNNPVIKFLKDWTLVVAMLGGVIAYFVLAGLPWLDSYHGVVMDMIGIVQPLLIFTMLFLTFCKVDLHHLRFRKWHLWLLLIQCGLFAGIGAVVMSLPQGGLRVVLEGAMLCLICPTATAGAVVTGKLGGNVGDITTYTILINLATALLIPAVVPFVHPHPGLDVEMSALLILGKVFPLLLLPLLAAVLVRHLFPAFHRRLLALQDLSFYLWAVALALAIAVTTRSIVNCDVAIDTQLWLVAVSFVCCGFQFYCGRRIGRRYGDRITAAQSLGQKNTVLAIWMGYTFFSPITAIVGGFYSIWHNLVNTYQLRARRQQSAPHPDIQSASI